MAADLSRWFAGLQLSSGIKVAFAVVGSSLNDAEGKVFKIKKSKLRGVESCGMLCSAKEIGISDEANKIMEFNEDVKEGTYLKESMRIRFLKFPYPKSRALFEFNRSGKRIICCYKLPYYLPKIFKGRISLSC